ncbi:hypothetical protein WA026_022061 [Henosepilachna vigintioctopunctata]|uniref:Uncharacterized protein n=1 Tax=Henosepilachna vigintioctopunctata TaxID=420089 RepID=A0AAW1UEB3_9CUCU
MLRNNTRIVMDEGEIWPTVENSKKTTRNDQPDNHNGNSNSTNETTMNELQVERIDDKMNRHTKKLIEEIKQSENEEVRRIIEIKYRKIDKGQTFKQWNRKGEGNICNET